MTAEDYETLISDVYCIVLGNKNMYHFCQCINLNNYMTYYCVIQKLYYTKKWVFLGLSHLCLDPLNTCLRFCTEETYSQKYLPKIFFLLIQNNSMSMHNSGTKHLILTDDTARVHSNEQIQNNSNQSATLEQFILIIIPATYLIDNWVLKMFLIRRVEKASVQPELPHSEYEARSTTQQRPKDFLISCPDNIHFPT